MTTPVRRIHLAILVVVIAVLSVIAYISILDAKNIKEKPGQKAVKESHASVCNNERIVELRAALKPRFIDVQSTESGENVFFVDADIYKGWRTYQTYCHACHATDAQGQKTETDQQTIPGAIRLAPPLLDSICIGRRSFEKKVAEGGNGMPSWRDNPLVIKRRKQIFVYLAALKLKRLEYSGPDHRNLRLRIVDAVEK